MSYAGTLLHLFFVLYPVLTLIGTEKSTLEQDEAEKVDSFSFEKGGTYTLAVTTSAPSNSTPAILVLIIEKGEDCNQIAKHCTYNLLKSESACSTVLSSDIYSNVLGLYPIMVPAGAYQTWDNTTTYQLNVSSWLPSQVANLSQVGLTSDQAANITLTDYINSVMTPTIVYNIQGSIQVLNSSLVTNPVDKIVTSISGGISSTANVAFGLINCIKFTVGVSTKYEFINPEGEHLPTIDLPFKVLHLVFACIWAFACFLGILTVAAERIKRSAYRLIHAFLLGICLLFLFMHVIFHIYWNQVSLQGYSDQKMKILKSSVTLAGTFFSLLLIVITSTGIMLASGVLMKRDYIILVVILAMYGIFAMLYQMYGSSTNFFVALIYMVCLVYVCMRVAKFISQTEVLIWDLQHAHNEPPGLLRSPNRKLQIMFWFRLYSLLLLGALLIGNILNTFLFSSYPWIPVIIEQSIIYVYFLVLIYLFRATTLNQNLYDDMPISPPDDVVLRELAQECEVRDDPIFQAAMSEPERLVLIRLPHGTNEKLCIGLSQRSQTEKGKADERPIVSSMVRLKL